jgi:hypothetical protein
VSEDVLGATRSAIAVARDGSLHVAWVGRGPGNGEILYTSKAPGGSWAPALDVSKNDGASGEPALAVGENGSPHVVWDDDTQGSHSVLYASPESSVAVASPAATPRALAETEDTGSDGGIGRGLLALVIAAGGLVLVGGVLVLARRRWQRR